MHNQQTFSPLHKAISALALTGATIFAPLVAQASTESVVKGRARAFYSWYVSEVKQGKDPFAKRATVRRYVSRRLEKWLYSPAFKEYGADYFTDAQDFDNDWDRLRAGKFRRNGNTATLQAVLGRPKPAGKGIGAKSINLKWVRESGVWKIDRVNDN